MKIFLGTLLLILLFSSDVYAKCIKGSCKNGYGIYEFSNGQRYEGNFKNSKYHGKGTFTHSNGQKYIGEYKNNQKNGKGTLEFFQEGNHLIYRGEFLHNQFHGEGILKDLTRKMQWSGIFKHNKLVKSKAQIENSTYTDYTIKIPVSIHILKVSKENFTTNSTEEDIRYDVERTNKMWKQAGVIWKLEEINYIKPSLENFKKNREYLLKWCNYKEACFEMSKNKLVYENSSTKMQNTIYEKLIRLSETKNNNTVNVYYLPKMLAKNACGITFKTLKSKEGWVIMGHECGNSDRSKTLAHELGHILGLLHIKDSNNLMNPSDSPGTKLNNAQILEARNYHSEYMK